MREVTIAIPYEITIEHKVVLYGRMFNFKLTAMPAAKFMIPAGVDSDTAFWSWLEGEFGLEPLKFGPFSAVDRMLAHDWKTDRLSALPDFDACFYAMDDIAKAIEKETGKRARLRIVQAGTWSEMIVRRRVWRWNAVIDEGGTPVLLPVEDSLVEHQYIDREKGLRASCEVMWPFSEPMTIRVQKFLEW